LDMPAHSGHGGLPPQASAGASARKAKAVHELRALFIIGVYLWLFFSVFGAYRALITQEVTRVVVFSFGYSALTALIVAKIILVGRWIKLGERHSEGFLIVSVLRKATAYAGFLVVFIVLEKIIEGLLRGEHARSTVAAMLGLGWDEIVARLLVVWLALVPLFAFVELDRVLGEGRLLALFWRRGAR